MIKLNYWIVTSVLLTACAQHTPPTPPKIAPVVPVPAPVVLAPPAAPAAPLPDVALTEEFLYQFLISEVAYQRGYAELAADGILSLAYKTRDPRLAKRASQLALDSNNVQASAAACRLWQTLDETTSVPTRLLSSLLLREGKLDEAGREFAVVLKQDTEQVEKTILQIHAMLQVYPDKNAAYQLMQNLAVPYPHIAEAHWAVAQLAHEAKEDAVALTRVRQARALREDWIRPVALEAVLLQKQAPQESLTLLQQFLAKNPEAREIRIQYARLLLEQKRYPQARTAFQQLAAANPNNVELAFAIALISLQMNDLAGAEGQLTAALASSRQESGTVRYYLGQLYEANKMPVQAIAHYREVKDGEHYLKSQMRVAYLLHKQGNSAEARQHLHQITPADHAQQVQIALVEAQLLRDTQQFETAYHLLQQLLTKLPNDPDLLYETGLLADKVGQYEASEKLFRKLMQLQPKRAHAYNALGFSLLERNVRIPEAVALVEKANQLAPDDIAIMDSVGWGYYRVGKLEDSIKWLRRAFAGNPDPEIASHLGEVLWVHGDKDEAKKIWQDSLKDNPKHPLLEAVIKKFKL